MKKIFFLCLILVSLFAASLDLVKSNNMFNMITWTVFGLSLASLSVLLGMFKKNRVKKYISEHNKEVFRLSYSYLIRIVFEDNLFLLVKSNKNDKYQPVGGVFHMNADSKLFWEKAGFNGDGTGDLLDFRGSVYGYNLNKILKMLERGINRETTIIREFREEVINRINTEYQKSFDSEIRNRYIKKSFIFGRETFYAQKNKMNVYLVYEVSLNKKQQDILRKMTGDYFRLFNYNEILNLGMDLSKNNHNPCINEHTRFLLSDKEENYES